MDNGIAGNNCILIIKIRYVVESQFIFVLRRNYTRHTGQVGVVVGEATVTFRWHSSRWTNCRRVEARVETCSLDKRSRGEEEDRMERARPKKGGVHAHAHATCALSRYWNDKWNIRNKSCKTLFSGDNTASSLWTLSRVGAPYCATSVGEVDERELTDSTRSRPLSPCTLPFLLSASSFRANPAFCPDRSPWPRPHGSLLFLTPLDSSLGPTETICISLSLSSFSFFLSFFLARSLSVGSFRDVYLSLSSALSCRVFRFDSRNGKSRVGVAG